MTKTNVTRAEFLDWDQFSNKPPSEALPVIYTSALAFSKGAREWYWVSIKTKRRWSIAVRGVAYLLAAAGVVLPLLSAVASDPTQKLGFTQLGVAAIVLAGVAQLGDRVFGWSSGWLRYVTTVTAMEKLVLQFELDWATYVLAHRDPLSPDDTKVLFELAKQLQIEIEKRRSEETDAWVTEFNAGMSALNEMLKSQKDATEKAVQSARSGLEAQQAQQKPGSIQVTIVQATNPPKPVSVYVDNLKQSTFVGSSWSDKGFSPGLHSVRVVRDEGAATQIIETKSVEVAPGAVANVEVKFP